MIDSLSALELHKVNFNGLYFSVKQKYAENKTRYRTPSDWQAVWHDERHRRCYNDLLSHMNLACRHDIYRVAKRPFIHYKSQTLEKGK